MGKVGGFRRPSLDASQSAQGRKPGDAADDVQGWHLMQKSRWFVLAVMLLATGLFGRGLMGDAQSMEATPVIVGTPGDVLVEYVGDTEPATAPGNTLELTRISLPPGSSIDVQDHPGASVMFVQTGAVEITVEQGIILLFPRAAGDPGPVANPTPCAPTCRVEAGWSAVQGDFTRHNLVDVSGTGSVVLVSQFTANATPDTATPTAAPASGRPITIFGCDGGCR